MCCALRVCSVTISTATDHHGNPSNATGLLCLAMRRECVKDCREALSIDATYTKGHLRLVKALCEVLLSTHSGALLREYLTSCACI